MTNRTVLDVASAHGLGNMSPHSALKALGVDPNMPYEQFTRWLHYGQRFDTVTPADADDGPPEWVLGWNDCVSYTRGDQP